MSRRKIKTKQGDKADVYGKRHDAGKEVHTVTLHNMIVGEKGNHVDLSPKEIRQHRFIEAYKSSLFNISDACRQIGVNRASYYRWCEEENFREMLNDAQEELRDFILHKLLEKVNDGHIIAILFAAKSICGLNEQGTQNLVIEDKRDEMTNEQRDAFIRDAIKNEAEKEKYRDMIYNQN